MKTKNEKKEAGKFGIERFEIAKLKSLHSIVGGGSTGPVNDDPADTNDHKQKKDSSVECHK
ncbi:hypothetical protein [Flavobacterium sp. ov086]|uniref:hypothetical protein n=1 Tax=Flavobacterium sp. ov086 TaxID=1761785 RepID=UPI000B691740|nr:hypothetical protein [Flavobacterium sp. ov086]SNR39967.1 hypothetical protein SAMN04487979_1052 [Flavobacterium sp. ov086]